MNDDVTGEATSSENVLVAYLWNTDILITLPIYQRIQETDCFSGKKVYGLQTKKVQNFIKRECEQILGRSPRWNVLNDKGFLSS